MRRLFGTDGIRGVAGQFPLDDSSLERIGLALTWTLRDREGVQAPRMMVGRDTRESGQQLEAALARGVSRGGGTVVKAGIVTTPAVAYLTRQAGFDAGVMISASHNPYHDNGIKIFSHKGYKLPDHEEEEIEQRILDRNFQPSPLDGSEPSQAEDLLERYLLSLASAVGGGRPFTGVRVALDCAHGGTYRIAPEIFSRLGASPLVIGDQPDGRNINEGCGSLHPRVLSDFVRRESADLGFAFDGAGDRVILVDRTGRVLDGDHVLYLAARDLQEAGELTGQTVVATVMSNLWLEKALSDIQIKMLRAPVGDRYVLEEMLKGGYALGGEQSGHIIFLGDATTGDGVLTALKCLDLIRRHRTDLAAWAQKIVRCPQVLLNVPVASRPPLDTVPALHAAMQCAEKELADRGRILLRYSGTEMILRIMVEGEDEKEIKKVADELRQATSMLARDVVKDSVSPQEGK